MKEYGDKFLCKAHANGGTLVSGIDGNGQEFIHCCVNCRIDDRGICQGDTIHCCNNIKNNSYEVYLMQGAKYIYTIAKGKDETLASIEVKKIADEWENNFYIRQR